MRFVILVAMFVFGTACGSLEQSGVKSEPTLAEPVEQVEAEESDVEKEEISVMGGKGSRFSGKAAEEVYRIVNSTLKAHNIPAGQKVNVDCRALSLSALKKRPVWSCEIMVDEKSIGLTPHDEAVLARYFMAGTFVPKTQLGVFLNMQGTLKCARNDGSKSGAYVCTAIQMLPEKDQVE